MAVLPTLNPVKSSPDQAGNLWLTFGASNAPQEPVLKMQFSFAANDVEAKNPANVVRTVYPRTFDDAKRAIIGAMTHDYGFQYLNPGKMLVLVPPESIFNVEGSEWLSTFLRWVNELPYPDRTRFELVYPTQKEPEGEKVTIKRKPADLIIRKLLMPGNTVNIPPLGKVTVQNFTAHEKAQKKLPELKPGYVWAIIDGPEVKGLKSVNLQGLAKQLLANRKRDKELQTTRTDTPKQVAIAPQGDTGLYFRITNRQVKKAMRTNPNFKNIANSQRLINGTAYYRVNNEQEYQNFLNTLARVFGPRQLEFLPGPPKTYDEIMAKADIHQKWIAQRKLLSRRNNSSLTGSDDDVQEGLRNKKDNPCWKGYHPVGTKKKNGRTVPNCVPGKADEDIQTEVKQRLDAKCWKGKHKEGTKIKGGVRVNNCVPNEDIKETAMRKPFYYRDVEEDNMELNLPPVNLTGGSDARTQQLATMAQGQAAKAPPVTQADKKMGATFERGGDNPTPPTRTPTPTNPNNPIGNAIMDLTPAGAVVDTITGIAKGDIGQAARGAVDIGTSFLGPIGRAGVGAVRGAIQGAGANEDQMAAPSGPQWDSNGGRHRYEESVFVDIEDDGHSLFEAGKASRAFCKANAKKRDNMGASQLSSCISQGYISHRSGKSIKLGDRRVKIDGKKLKGEKYGGPKSTRAGESS